MSNENQDFELTRSLLELADNFPLESEVYYRPEGSIRPEDETIGKVIGYELCRNELMVRVLYKGAIKTWRHLSLMLVKDAREFSGTVISSENNHVKAFEDITILMKEDGVIKDIYGYKDMPVYKILSLEHNIEHGQTVTTGDLEKYKFSFISRDKIYKVDRKEATCLIDLSDGVS